MRTTLAVLAAITFASCTDQATLPGLPKEADTIHFPSLAGQVLSGSNAVRHRVRLFEAELADPRLLELNAALNRLDTEERREKVTAEIERFKSLDTSPVAASSNQSCSPQELDWTETYLSASWVSPGVGAGIYSTGYSVVDNGRTKHRIKTYVEGGKGNYPGFPSYTANTEVTKTSGCEQVFTVHSEVIYISFEEWCWWAYGESLHQVLTTDTEKYTSALYDRCGGPRVGPVV